MTYTAGEVLYELYWERQSPDTLKWSTSDDNDVLISRRWDRLALSPIYHDSRNSGPRCGNIAVPLVGVSERNAKQAGLHLCGNCRRLRQHDAA